MCVNDELCYVLLKYFRKRHLTLRFRNYLIGGFFYTLYFVLCTQYYSLMILLSIDPGYDKTGYAVFQSDHPSKISFITSGLIKTNKTDELVSRLKVISTTIATIIEEYKVDAMVMEQLFFFKNAKTVIAVAQAQGSLIALAADKGLDFHFLTPLQIKQIVTGDGHADKKSVWKMLKLQLGDKLVVADDDESDAIACGYAYCLVTPIHGVKLMQ